ncbi:MAG: zf-HC2 domain-containing protein [Planctomycetes bacterium]|jgi:anti-sigma factor RsiW|nr:zf-HC2 domain-containing protein [Planctomycetota bacterium]
MACREFKSILPDYVAGGLPEDQAALVKEHLPACDSCRETVRFLKMDDATVHAALLGARHRGPPQERRRLVRGIVFLLVVTAVILLVLYLLYGGMLGPFAPLFSDRPAPS